MVQTEAEEDVSGSKKSPSQRSAFGRILSNVDNLDAVLFWKIDRIARNTLDFLLLARDLRERGVALAAVEDPVDLTTPAGEVVATVLVAFAQFEAAQISARIKAARAHLLREGRIAGGERPWPFEAVSRGEDEAGLVWRPIPNRAEAVRAAVTGIIDGTTNPSAVATEWDRRGLRPKRGLLWDPSSVRVLLKNPAIYGARIYHGAVMRNADGTVRIDEGQAIIDQASFRDLQTALESRATHRARPETDLSLLHGIAICDPCGALLYPHRPSDPRKPARYVCKGKGCPSPVAVSMARLEEHVVKEFVGTYGHLNVIERVVEQAGVDPGALAEIEEALGATQADLDATDDENEAVKLIQRRKALRERLMALQDEAASATVIRHVDTGRTFREVWDATDDKTDRRALLSHAYGALRIKKGRRGRHGLDTSRIVPVPPEAMQS